MPNEVLPRYAKGERLRHGDWNRLAQTVEGHDRLVTGGGLLARKTGTSLELYDPRMRPIDARITGNTGNAYAWEQVQQFEGGVYESPAGARTGTADFAPAYARSGSTSVPTGTYVVLWPQFGGLFYLFDAPAAAGSLTVASRFPSTTGVVSLPTVTTIQADGSRGLLVGRFIEAFTFSSFNEDDYADDEEVDIGSIPLGTAYIPSHRFLVGDRLQMVVFEDTPQGVFAVLRVLDPDTFEIGRSTSHNAEAVAVGKRFYKINGNTAPLTINIANGAYGTGAIGLLSGDTQYIQGDKGFAEQVVIGGAIPDPRQPVYGTDEYPRYRYFMRVGGSSQPAMSVRTYTREAGDPPSSQVVINSFFAVGDHTDEFFSLIVGGPAVINSGNGETTIKPRIVEVGELGAGGPRGSARLGDVTEFVGYSSFGEVVKLDNVVSGVYASPPGVGNFTLFSFTPVAVLRLAGVQLYAQDNYLHIPFGTNIVVHYGIGSFTYRSAKSGTFVDRDGVQVTVTNGLITGIGPE